MTTQNRRLVFLISGLALVLCGICVVAARETGAFGVFDQGARPVASIAPPIVAEEPEVAFAIGTGALVQDMRRNVSSVQYAAVDSGSLPASNRLSLPAMANAPPPVLEVRAKPDFVPPWPPARPASLRSLTTLASVEPVAPIAPVPADVAPAAPAPAPEGATPPDRSGGGNFRMGSAAYVRIFKQEGQLELWLKRDGRFALFRTYAICKWSGTLGPKLREADYQSPEGFYAVSARQLNPHSHYDRAFNVGFPNAFDRRQGRTGGDLMVHGDCKSVGCFAMTNKGIEEIFGYVEAAIKGGQREVPVHIFPFRLTEAAITKQTKGDWTSLWNAPNRNWGEFWHNLKEGYDLFEQTGEPPTAYACGDRYAFGAVGKSCQRIAGW